MPRVFRAEILFTGTALTRMTLANPFPACSALIDMLLTERPTANLAHRFGLFLDGEQPRLEMTWTKLHGVFKHCTRMCKNLF
jgi:hypothetical protein